MQREAHDEVSMEVGRRVAVRLREQPALLQINDELPVFSHAKEEDL